MGSDSNNNFLMRAAIGVLSLGVFSLIGPKRTPCFESPPNPLENLSPPQMADHLVNYLNEKSKTSPNGAQFAESARYLATLSRENPEAYRNLGAAMHENDQVKFNNFKNYAERACKNNPENPHALLEAVQRIVDNPKDAHKIIKRAAGVDVSGSPNAPSFQEIQRVIRGSPEKNTETPSPPLKREEPPAYTGATATTTMPGVATTMVRGQLGGPAAGTPADLASGKVLAIQNPGVQGFLGRVMTGLEGIKDTFDGGGHQTSLGNDFGRLPRALSEITGASPEIRTITPHGREIGRGPASTLGVVAPSEVRNDSPHSQRYQSVGYNLGVGTS